MRVSKDPEVRRQEIVNTAGRLFQKQGIAKTSITEIARQMGVAKGLVYYYFSSKDELVEAVIDDFTVDLDQELATIQQQEDLDFAGKLKAVLHLYFDAIQSHPAILSFTPADPTAFSLLKEKLSAIAYARVQTILAAGRNKGLIEMDYPEYMLKILIRGLGDLYIEGIRDPKIHATIIEQALGLDKNSL